MIFLRKVPNKNYHYNNIKGAVFPTKPVLFNVYVHLSMIDLQFTKVPNRFPQCIDNKFPEEKKTGHRSDG